MRRLTFLCLLIAGCVVSATAWVDETAFIEKRRNFWSFQKPVRPPVPAIADSWVRNPIDAFLLEAMTEKGIKPSPPLSKERLLRRLSLDLTGLPPTPGEVDLFLRDTSADAYEKAVDRLLASPHYGERWALRWLDVARYADTNGYELDKERPHAWRYRDYVVRSFNADKPYDRFLQEQIAGDELWPDDKDALIATGFHRAGPIHLVSGNLEKEMLRQEFLTEMTSGVSAAFLGLTVGCARCHNHKFDPILQADYYRLQALFAGTEGKDVEIATPAEKQRYAWEKQQYDARMAVVKEQIDAIEKPYREQLKREKTEKLEARFREALNTPEAQRSPEQKRLAKEAMSQVKPTWDEVVQALSPADRDRRAGLRRQMHEIELDEPEPLPTAYAVANTTEAPPTHILKIGDYKNKLGVVEPGFLKVLARDAQVPQTPQGRRTALARWLASPDHPLTARVMANRIWQLRMGNGLVRTPNDFGALGERPTNPKLLDWLASEFVAQGWRVKAIDRLIVTSNAYRQSAANDTAKAAIDPENKLYWRMNRRRLEGEMLRDNVLAVSGALVPRLGGHPVRAPIEPEVYDIIFTEDEPDNLWPLPKDRRETYRRSLYLINKRNVRLPMLANFDQPDTMTSCPVRGSSTHALQALSLLNSDFMREESDRFAARVKTECAGDRACEVRRAYRVALARTPQAAEIRMASDFFQQGGQLADFCLALLNRNEFVYVP